MMPEAACDKCGAQPGEWCRTRTGQRAYKQHARRRDEPKQCAPYRTRLPPRQRARPCLLFRVYTNMRGRALGGSTKSPWCYVEGWPWLSYAEFRAWALKPNAHGPAFSKLNCSPDRVDTTQPYGPINVRWCPKHVNCSGSSGRAWFMRGHDDVRGREPPPSDYVPF